MKMNDDKSQFKTKYGSWGLVTGAAQGLGEAFAESVAQRGLNVLMLDRNQDALSCAAVKLRDKYSVDIRTLVCDLAATGFMEEVVQETEDLEIGLLICNAAVGKTARFLDLSSEDIESHIAVNCRSTALLTSHFAHTMAKQKRGGIMLIGSASGLHGSPMFSAYAATKAFEMILAESLWYELQSVGVDVISFIPGPTNTPGLRLANPGLKEGQTTDAVSLPGDTAEIALRGLGNGPVVARDEPLQQRLDGRGAMIKAMGERFFK